MKYYALIGPQSLTFSSELAKHKFFENTGKYVVLEIDDKPTAEMRRFFEGAVVPYVYYQNDQAGWKDFREAREALKVEFLPSYAKSLTGEEVRLARSTSTLSKRQFTTFLETVLRWMDQNGFEAPDPDDFNRWKNSAPLAGEVYPPLQRIKDRSTH